MSAALRIIEVDHDSLSLNSRFKKASRSLLFHMLKVVVGHEQRLGNTDATLLPAGYLEALGPQVYWSVNLYITRFLYIFAPYEVIHSAEALVKEMHKDVSARISSPIDIYSLSLAVLTLLEASKLPLCAEFCWKILGNIEQILDRRAQVTATAGEFEDLFSTPKWDNQLRAWIEAEKPLQHQRINENNNNNNNNNSNNTNNNNNPAELTSAGNMDQQHQNPASTNNPTTSSTNNAANNNNISSSQAAPPPFVGPNEQRSLQHLADLAVGAEGAGGNEDGTAPQSAPQQSGAGTGPPSTMDISHEAEGGLHASGSIGGGHGAQGVVDFSVALRKGFMNVLSMAPGSRH